ncbi:MAG: FAD-dependent oxidoreductase [Caulobacterales bacterium]|nr:FAD-dependent oxidoreductase [Caulobacterales bacterium]
MARAFDILIVGGGQAARRAAEGARAVAPEASIAIVGEETHPPYDRPPLSKEILLGKADASLCCKRDAASFAADRIELILGTRVAALHLNDHKIETASGERIGYGKLIIATGSRARSLPAPAAIADKVLTLRTIDDATRVAAHLHEGAHIVVIGAGFIGLEAASAARARGARVTVLEAADRVLGRVFPIEAAARVERLHRDAGVDLRLGAKLDEIAPDGGRVRVSVGAEKLLADLVVVGIGIIPNTELARAAGLAVDDGVVVSAEGATSHADVFAAGEVTRHPVRGASAMRIESWQVAELQADAAGRSAAGAPTAYDAIPYFWSDQYGVNMQMFGLIRPDGAILVRAAGESALIFSIGADGRIAGAIGFNAGADMSIAKRMIGAPAPVGLEDAATPLRKLLRAGATA